MIKFNNDKLFFAILIIWSLFLAKVIPVEIREIENDYFYFKINLEKKYELIDGNFYKFMKVCAQRIPEDVDVVFIVGPEAKVDKFMSYGWLESRYYIAKAAYFLYPRRVVEKNFKPLNLLKYIIQYNYNAEKQEFCLNQR